MENIMEIKASRFFFMCMMFIVIPLVSAQISTLGTFTANSDVNLSQVCATCTYVNLQKVKFPDSSETFINANMTKQGQTFYYTFSDTAQYGQYIVTTCGDLLGGFECASYDFFITSNGQRFSTSQALSLIPLMIMVVLLFAIGWSFSAEKWKIKSFFFATSLLTTIVMINIMTIMFGTSESLQSMGQTTLILGIAIFSFYIMFLLIYYTIEVVNQLKDFRENRRKEKSDPY